MPKITKIEQGKLPHEAIVYLDGNMLVGYIVDLNKVNNKQTLIADLKERLKQKKPIDFIGMLKEVKKAEGSDLEVT